MFYRVLLFLVTCVCYLFNFQETCKHSRWSQSWSKSSVDGHNEGNVFQGDITHYCLPSFWICKTEWKSQISSFLLSTTNFLNNFFKQLFFWLRPLLTTDLMYFIRLKYQRLGHSLHHPKRKLIMSTRRWFGNHVWMIVIWLCIFILQGKTYFSLF